MQTLPKGALLFEQGTMPEVLHVILSGRVALMGELPEEAAAVVEFFNAGDALIVPAVVLDLEYLLSAQVVAEARILMIQVALFRHCLNTDIALAAAATRLLSVHWRRLIEQIKHLKLLSATRRLAAYLLGNAPMESGSARFRFRRAPPACDAAGHDPRIPFPGFRAAARAGRRHRGSLDRNPGRGATARLRGLWRDREPGGSSQIARPSIARQQRLRATVRRVRVISARLPVQPWKGRGRRFNSSRQQQPPADLCPLT